MSESAMRRSGLAVLCLLLALAALAPPANGSDLAPAATPTPRFRLYLPVILADGSTGGDPDACASVPGAAYQALSVPPPPSDRPAEAHADLNLALRSYLQTSGFLGLVDYAGGADSAAPQLPALFANHRTATVLSVYRVNDWNWACNCRGGPISSPAVTLAMLSTTNGEIISAPTSGYQIGNGKQALVLYAAADRLTLKYTREDNVVHGYTVHLESVCVEPQLLALYRSLNAAGRSSLPAVSGGQALGRARGTAIGVSVRDNGSFLDPRSRKDWWQGH